MSGEPRPLRFCMLAQVLALGGVLAWWASLPPPQRWGLLSQIAQGEQARCVPPVALRDQAVWLAIHRLTRLQGVTWLVSVALLLGIAEGMAHRHRDTLSGFRLAFWTSGVVVLAVLPGIVGGLILAPWPVAVRLLALVGTGLSGSLGWLLAAGRPQIQ